VTIAGPRMERPLGILNRRDRPLSTIAQQFIDLLCSDVDFSPHQANSVNGSATHLQTKEILSPRR
jgi:hypothetical protein